MLNSLKLETHIANCTRIGTLMQAVAKAIAWASNNREKKTRKFNRTRRINVIGCASKQIIIDDLRNMKLTSN